MFCVFIFQSPLSVCLLDSFNLDAIYIKRAELKSPLNSCSGCE